MERKLNGFNNGRDTTDGVGGKPPINLFNSIDDKLKESEDRYVRLYAEFENYKRRVQKEKDEVKYNTTTSIISSILDLDNDLSIAIKNIKDKQTKESVELISNKVERFLNSHGVESIQTNTYDVDIHEVISVVETGTPKILDVASKGYSLNGKPFRYPKVILGK